MYHLFILTHEGKTSKPVSYQINLNSGHYAIPNSDSERVISGWTADNIHEIGLECVDCKGDSTCNEKPGSHIPPTSWRRGGPQPCAARDSCERLT